LRGASELSEKVDLFAFGTTLFELCEGIMEKELGIGMMLLSGADKPKIAEGTYAGRLENLIHACWNHHPADRPTAEALVQYASHLLAHNYWPPILEYNPDDKAVADLPHGAHSETVRVTVGRPTILNQTDPDLNPQNIKTSPASPEQQPAEEPQQEGPPPFIPIAKTMPPYAANSKTQTSNYMKIGIIGFLAVLLLISGVYFARKVERGNAFKDYLQKAFSLNDQNRLKEAYDAVNSAREIFPNDSTAIKLRREIIRNALEQHTGDLNEVRGALAAHDASMYEELCNRLAEHESNASILRGGDSTAYFRTLIPGCTGKVDPPPTTTYSGNTGVKEPGKSENGPDPSVKPTKTPPLETDAEVQERRKIVEEMNDWNAARRKNQKESLESFLKKWPDGPHVSEAQNLLATIVSNTSTPSPNNPNSGTSPGTAILSNSGTAALPLAERIKGCKTLGEGGVITLRPKTDIELSELVLFADSPGKVQIALLNASGQKMRSTRGVVSAGVRAQITLEELDVQLRGGSTYQLVITPLRDEKGASPLLENMRNCSPSPRSGPNLSIDYQGNFIVFDLKYHY
jgi:hypothetical protein